LERAVKERESPRQKSFLKATIRFHSRNVTVDCVVRNISLTGARLEIERTFTLPMEFELEIPQRGAVLQCQLKWRKDAAAGVRFKDSVRAAPAQSGNVADAGIEALREENAALRLEIGRLVARIQQLEGMRESPMPPPRA
jgi:PilZ domain